MTRNVLRDLKPIPATNILKRQIFICISWNNSNENVAKSPQLRDNSNGCSNWFYFLLSILKLIRLTKLSPVRRELHVQPDGLQQWQPRPGSWRQRRWRQARPAARANARCSVRKFDHAKCARTHDTCAAYTANAPCSSPETPSRRKMRNLRAACAADRD